MEKIKVGVISLGCDKNRVDTEKMLYFISQRFDITSEVEKADVVIINTCAFLEASREEAIEEILQTALLKKTGTLKKLIVTGCLPQKFIGEIYDELQEVDGFLGVSDYEKINDVIDRALSGERVNEVGLPRGECGKKRVVTTNGYAYLKIADGCSNHCTYCLIPKIRGAFRSVNKEELIEEVKELGFVSELILVGQDVTRYGEDLTPKSSLVELIRDLSALKNVGGIRLLYCYPELVGDDLIHEIATNAKMIRYIDIPFQHADDKILKLMNRRGTCNEYLNLVEKLKREVSGIAIRSTFITGFPFETEEAFDNLIAFIKKAKLFNAGFFKYSKEEDTPSFKMEGHIEEKVKDQRLKKLYSVQKEIVKENNKALIGKMFNVFTEGYDDKKKVYFGRAYFNAPDIDGKVLFVSNKQIALGDRVNVKIIKSSGYDLIGETV